MQKLSPERLLPLILTAWMAQNPTGTLGQQAMTPVAKVKYGDHGGRGTLQLRGGISLAEFLPDRAFLNVEGHALKVEFAGTPGVVPTMAVEPGARPGMAFFSQRVLYENLWPGVRMIFALNPKGRCEAKYILGAGSEIARIRLRYDVPVSLQEDGTLRFQFASGPVIESSPEAWQLIGGKRVSVKASFTVTGGEVGFSVGSYDSRYDLVIDPEFRAH